MSTCSYAICRSCKQILDLDKFLHYPVEDGDYHISDHYRIGEKLQAFLAWAKEHAHHAHGIHLVDEYDQLMEESHHGWMLRDWSTGENTIIALHGRFSHGSDHADVR